MEVRKQIPKVILVTFFIGYFFGYEDNLACFKPTDSDGNTDLMAQLDDTEEDDWDDWDEEEEEEEELEEDEAVDPPGKCMWGLVKHLITIERKTEIR